MKCKNIPFFLIFFILNFLFLVEANAQIYFQQKVDYKIEVTLNDKKNELYAFETITYKNNSPTALKEIYIHLWANAYKNRETALCRQMVKLGDTKLFFAADEDRGYIDSLDFKINGLPVQWKLDSFNIDICKLILPKKLMPGEQVVITTPFYVKIPSAVFSRFGHLGQAYMITQWYPKPAVFDAQGWHPMPNLQYGEYYSEFGSYEVKITLPKNYVVGGTGDLQDENELAWLNEKALATSKINSFETDLSFPKSDQEKKTITYVQNNVHDFAWFADKRYHVLKGELELPHTKRKITLWSLFTNSEPQLWKHSIEYIHDAAYYYSLWNGDYLYNQITAVDGTISSGTGMEYPTITVIGKSYDPFTLETVIVHEVGHNWFYGILANNERDHPWMDEGINSFYEMRYVMTKYPEKEFGKKNEMTGLGIIGDIMGADQFNYKQMSMTEYLFVARTWNDQPIDIHSTEFTRLNYGAILYKKTAIAFDYLRQFLGSELFDKCMQQFYLQWQLMHPYPENLQGVFEDVSKQNLEWFFGDIIKTSKKVDYKICNANKIDDTTYTLTISNKGSTKSPLTLTAFKGENITRLECLTGLQGNSKVSFTAGDADRIIIGYDYEIPDVNMNNNFIRTSGILKKSEPIKFKFLTGIEQPQYTQVYYSPIIGWNEYDKFMIGAAIHNQGVIPKKFEYVALPMYSFNTQNFAGQGSVNYNYFKHERFEMQISLTAMHYAYGTINFTSVEPNQNFLYSFTKLQPDILFRFRKNATAEIIHQLSVKNYFISSNNDFTTRNNTVNQQYVNYYYNELIYTLNNKRTIDPLNLSTGIQTGKDFMKTFFEANYNFSYKKRQKGVSFRFFAGRFLYYDSSENLNFRMSGFTGSNDYLFNDIYLGRSESMTADNSSTASRQFTEHDGAFKVYTGVGQTDKWLAALNMKITIPGLPIMYYMDFGTYSNAKNAYEGSKALMYDGGLAIWIIRDVAEIYFPLFYSSDISKNLQAESIDKFKQRIRFQLNLNLLNPLKLQRQIFN